MLTIGVLEIDESLEPLLWARRDFFYFRPCTAFSDKFSLTITGINTCHLIPEDKYEKILFISSQPDKKNYYSFNFGEYLSYPCDMEDIDFSLKRLIQRAYVFPIKEIKHLFSKMEFELCTLLSENAGHIISYDLLIKSLGSPGKRSITEMIYKINKKINNSRAKDFITIRNYKNLGYQWINQNVDNLWITL